MLEPLFEHIEPMQEIVAIRVCLLLMELYLACSYYTQAASKLCTSAGIVCYTHVLSDDCCNRVSFTAASVSTLYQTSAKCSETAMSVRLQSCSETTFGALMLCAGCYPGLISGLIVLVYWCRTSLSPLSSPDMQLASDCKEQSGDKLADVV